MRETGKEKCRTTAMERDRGREAHKHIERPRDGGSERKRATDRKSDREMRERERPKETRRE